MNHMQVIEDEAYLSFDFWPMDYKETWPQDGEAKVYVFVEWPEEDHGIKLGLFCHYFINGVGMTDELSKESLKEMYKQAREEFDKKQESEKYDL